MKKLFVFFIFLFIAASAYSQVPGLGGPGNISNSLRTKNNTRGSDTTKRKTNTKLDTLGFEHRDDLADSISLSFRYPDSTRWNSIDSSVDDFDRYFPVPSTYQHLGNNGLAAFPLVYKPFTKAGWDPGFHAFDIYKFTVENTKLFRTTGPFSMLGYQLAGGKEQMIQALHTQSPRPNMNFGFEYRLISAPGYFVTQNTNHNNIRLWGTYRGKKKRYGATIVILSNAIKASENGGITADSLLSDPNKKERFSVPVNLGGALPYTPNPFQASVKTGNIYKEHVLFFRHSYDIGKRDSVAVNDSTTEYLFYPKLRLQHTITASMNSYEFIDIAGDSTLYKNWYGITLPQPTDSFRRFEKWRSLTNDFSLVQFPDTKNSNQFFLAGASLQTLKESTDSTSHDLYNVMLHAEYRNRTRNKLWDVLLKGEFYLNGLNSGDYSAYGSLNRYINKKFGDVSLYFNNVSRTPSFIFDNRSPFNLGNNNDYKKENITSFGAVASNPLFTIGFNNYLINNYTYFYDYYHSDQYSKPVNVLQVYGAKTFKLSKKLRYHAYAAVQQSNANGPVHVPLIFTRSRIAYEGSLYKNLKVSAGLEIRYFTPYKADNYSPVLGRFTPQDTVVIHNRPDIAAFIHFRIKGFTLYFRAENLNTVSFKNGFDFTDNNFAAPHYPTPGFMMRFGIRWWFVK